MDIEIYRTFCLQFLAVTETFPFDQTTLVYKIANKIFTLASIAPFDRLNVKCDPEKALLLRNTYQAVLPGYHMNKKHWNTILLSQDLTTKQICQMIKDSYFLVINTLPKKDKEKYIS